MPSLDLALCLRVIWCTPDVSYFLSSNHSASSPETYPLRCVTLLLRTILILFQDTVDNTDERIELRADRRPRPDITRWHRIAQHLPDRARVDPKTTSRFALAQTLNHYRVANPPIQFHSLHPPPFAPKCKGLSLTELCSGATRLSGRFSEGLLLRRSHELSGLGPLMEVRRLGGRVEEGRGGLYRIGITPFPFPLIKPDVRISRIRLSDWLHPGAHGGGPR